MIALLRHAALLSERCDPCVLIQVIQCLYSVRLNCFDRDKAGYFNDLAPFRCVLFEFYTTMAHTLTAGAATRLFNGEDAEAQPILQCIGGFFPSSCLRPPAFPLPIVECCVRC